ncbi:MAG: AAA family ATPase, partial [Chitinophagales bacterium]
FQSDSDYVAELYDETEFEVILMAGIAGSGKDTYVEKYGKGLPIVSLDAVREELNIRFSDKDGQGKVVQHAYELAKEYCRKKQAFIWNSTNLSLRIREKLIRTLLVYKPRIKIVYVETSLKNIYERRKTQIKAKNMTSMLRILDMPQLTEVHEIEVVKN